MNREEFKKNIGRTIQFIPPPRRDSSSGSWESDMNLWILRGETPDKKGFEFLNAIRDHDPFILDQFQIRNFDAPDKLVLRGQVVLKDSSVIFEPFHPKPASTVTTHSDLRLFIEGADETGSCVITFPALDPFRFCVINAGEQTVRDYRNTVLIPQAFKRPSTQSYLGNLSKQDETVIGDKEYVVYGNFVNNPIYKKESIRIGEIMFQVDPGEYVVLWQIRCDDGIFPGEAKFGEIKVKSVPLTDLVVDAAENLYKKP